MSVRTAANACSRVGLGTTVAGAARTCSDRVGWSAGDGLGQGLTTASIAVSPFDRQRPEVSPGRPHQSYAPWADSTHARRPDAAFPFYMASIGSFAPVQSLPFGSQAFLLAPAGRSLYIASREARNRATASSTVVEAHVERGLQQPNPRIGREYSPARPARQSRRDGDRPFQALRLDPLPT